MDLAAGRLCFVFVQVIQSPFVQKDFRIAAATILDSTVKRIVPDRDVMN